MDMYQDGIEIFCLPDGVHFQQDEFGRSPLDIDECPIGNETCNGDCQYYEE